MLSQQLNAKRQASWQIYQIYRNVASKTTLAQETISLEQAKPYAEVPGPSKFQMIRAFMPGGRYKNAPAHEMFLDLSRQFGGLFRMPSIAGTDMVLTMNPQDYATVFRNEGQWPYRRSFTTVEYFRKVRRPEVFGEYDGLVSGNGAAWGKMRTAVNPILLQPRNAKLYLKNLVQVSDEFLERIRLIRDPVSQEMPDDFTEDIRNLVIESIGSVALNTHLGLLGENRYSDEANQLKAALKDFVELGFQLDMMPAIWKYLPVPKFNQLMRSLDTITDFCCTHIEQALQRIEEDVKAGKMSPEMGMEASLLEKLSRFDRQTAVIIAMDFLFAGTDPTLVSLVGILLSLAKNPDKQARLLEEINQILPGQRLAPDH
ncbi:GL23701 [Drosophila persimilis]|uniref:GL23701 n=1 Tax=Drosophila persimilis TaxID=7234 RepID=B4G691_DROPE|nr:GL23701 [Drosophila persimilis]